MKSVIANTILTITLISLCTGCASILDGRDKRVHLTSNPPGAKVTVLDNHGKTVSVQNTPAVVRLERSEGFFVPAKYKFVYELEGYYPSEVPINANLNPLYFGNILFGGVIGLLIVDPATGAMWTIPYHEVNRNLVPSSSAMSPEELKVAEATANPPKKREAPQPTGKGAATRY